MINLKNKLVKGSIILLSLIGIFNLLNFLYHFIMARSLSLEDFGLLKRVFAFLYIGAIFMESIQTVVVKYASENSSEDKKLKYLFIKTSKKIIIPSLIVFFAFLILSLFISPLFNISYSLLLVTSLFILGSMFVPITRGILQGQQRFFALGSSMIFEAILKIGISFLFVYLGFGVFGAIGGVMASLFLSLLFSLIFIRKILSGQSEQIKLEGIRSYSRPVFVITLVLILFINVDVLIAGNLFNDVDAGIYSIASTIALIIFIGVQPINKVLFPISVVDSTQNKSSKSNFLRALFIVSAICSVALIGIIIFTEEIIYLLSGKIIPEATSPTILLSIGTSFLSLTSTILYYKLSKGKTGGYFLTIVFLFIEIVLLAIFSKNIATYSIAFLIANFLFFIGAIFLLKK